LLQQKDEPEPVSLSSETKFIETVVDPTTLLINKNVSSSEQDILSQGDIEDKTKIFSYKS